MGILSKIIRATVWSTLEPENNNVLWLETSTTDSALKYFDGDTWRTIVGKDSIYSITNPDIDVLFSSL